MMADNEPELGGDEERTTDMFAAGSMALLTRNPQKQLAGSYLFSGGARI